MIADRKKLRELLERESVGDVSTEEVEAVFKLIATLEEEDNAIRLPADFSEKVVQRVIQKQVRESRLGWSGYFLGIFGLIICLVISLTFVDFTLDFGFLKNISGYSGLLIFGAGFILLLNLIDKKLIRFTS